MISLPARMKKLGGIELESCMYKNTVSSSGDPVGYGVHGRAKSGTSGYGWEFRGIYEREQ